ncbi:MAG: DUF962 domain-containing protein [Moraxellaceae bacterium]|nr:DUF962 domain-containing protein [Moraxellaceae bacterium]
MRTEQEFLAEYAKSHRNRTNQIVHMICVPLIFIATFGLFWLIPLGSLVPSLPEAWLPYVNVATVGVIPVLAFYARLSLSSFVTGVIWLAVSIATVLLLKSLAVPLLPVLAAVWVLAWAGQFWGHKVEGAKPSFADDLVFLLIGPLFVQQKLKSGL